MFSSDCFNVEAVERSLKDIMENEEDFSSFISILEKGEIDKTFVNFQTIYNSRLCN